MKRKRIALVVGAAVCVAIAIGAALAIADQPTNGFGPVGPVYSGVTPNGKAYEISRVDSEHQALCFPVAADAVSGRGCMSGSGAETLEGVAEVWLGDNLFVLALAGDQSEELRVTRVDDRGTATSRHVVDLGTERLLHAVLHTPQATVPETDFGLPVPPALRVEAIDGEGAATGELTLNGPESGGEQGQGSVPADRHSGTDNRHSERRTVLESDD